ncbi:restriction endonuclease subunit S [Levilactobacillus tujiorum]|uniref:restriction endonuclease subunit S n=1 Tax=Levilactobacillus tujiorum TaxID=2912243 RepID=UPI001E5C6517|nr:restriction endonuclease subunit S [Levilactobacillus tujiorum]
MMDSKSFIPRVRFKSCYNPWIIGPIGDFLDERTERSSKGELLSVTIDSGIVKARTLERKDNSSKDKSNYRVVRKNDIAYNSMRMWQGASGRSSYDGIVSPAYTVLLPKHGVSTRFFSYAFKQTKMLQVFQSNSQGLTSDTWNLKFNLLKSIKVITPSLDEQEKIAEVLLKMDRLIVTSEKKVFELKRLKRLLLQNMFNRFWRFDGFTLPWEQRKLNDYLTESLIKGSSGSNSKKLTVKLWGKGVVPKVNNWRKGSENTKYYVRHTGQLMYGKLDFLHAAFGIVPKSLNNFESTIDSPAFDISIKINSKFLLYSVLQRRFYVKQGSIANGSRKAKRVHEATFLEMSIHVPEIKEQSRISGLLDIIENLIVANERYPYQTKQNNSR